VTERTTLPLIVMGRSLSGSPLTSADNPTAVLEFETEAGGTLVASFTLRGLLTTAVMANNWSPLRGELDQLEAPEKAAAPMCYEAAKLLLDSALKQSAALDAALALVEPLCNSAQFSSFKQMVGGAMGAMLVELINPIVAKYPDLKPSGME
jgi:hypothetical protein